MPACLTARRRYRLSRREELKVADSRGQVRTLPNTNFSSGFAWTPDGNEVWFTSISQAGGSAIWATSPLTETERLVYQGVSELVLEDIAPDGRVLVSAENTRWEVAARPAGEQRELRLSVDDSTLAALSDDGQQILFTSFTSTGPVAYLRQTDGSAPLKLGAGEALDLSPDKRWALVRPPVYAGSLSLLPTGSGVARTLSLGGLHQSDAHQSDARLLHDGTGVVVNGLKDGQVRSELYLVPLDGGSPAPFSDGGVTPNSLEISRDDHFVAAQALDEVLTLYPTDAGLSVPLPDLGKDAVPIGWTLEGQLWVQVDAFRGFPSHVVLYDIKRHQIVEERTVTLGDRTGVLRLFSMKVTADGGALAFSYRRSLGYLYILEGLAPPSRR